LALNNSSLAQELCAFRAKQADKVQLMVLADQP
jgi:hypothetical protein